MLKIDMHTHILPKEMPNWFEKFGYGNFIQLIQNSNNTADMMPVSYTHLTLPTKA